MLKNEKEKFGEDQNPINKIKLINQSKKEEVEKRTAELSKIKQNLKKICPDFKKIMNSNKLGEEEIENTKK